MKRRIINSSISDLLFGFILATNIIFCKYSIKATTRTIKRVIYLTLDGVRWQDVFLNRSYFSTFWNKHAKNASRKREREERACACIPLFSSGKDSFLFSLGKRANLTSHDIFQTKQHPICHNKYFHQQIDYLCNVYLQLTQN